MNWIIALFKKQGHGHVVNISSVAMQRGGSKLAPAYNASKAYQTNYLEGLHQKMFAEKRTIHITDIRPGLSILLWHKATVCFGALKEKAAKQIYRAIKKKKAVAYITKRWLIIGRLLALLPKGGLQTTLKFYL